MSEAAATRRTVWTLCGVMYFYGYTMAINFVASPWIEKSFGLGDSGIAWVYAWISCSALGALLLSRLADRLGRRRVLLWCMTCTPLSALGAAAQTRLAPFVAFEILMYAFLGATLAGAVVMLAETLPLEGRARGQSYGGLAMSTGSGLGVLLMPLLESGGRSWRWLLVISACAILGLPFVRRALPESRRWEQAAETGAVKRSRFLDVFGPRHRRRSISFLICYLLTTMATAAVTTWGYYHAVRVADLAPGVASLMIVLGGGLGLAGFPLAVRGCDRFGRVPTVAACGVLFATGGALFYWGPLPGFAWPTAWLGATFAWFTISSNALMVGSTTAATELFPTALRGTMIGWFSLVAAVATVAAQGLIAQLAGPFGGLSRVAGGIGLLAIPGALLFLLLIDETKGLSLEVASRE